MVFSYLSFSLLFSVVRQIMVAIRPLLAVHVDLLPQTEVPRTGFGFRIKAPQ